MVFIPWLLLGDLSRPRHVLVFDVNICLVVGGHVTYIRVLLNLYKMAAVFIILNRMLSWTVFEIFTF